MNNLFLVFPNIGLGAIGPSQAVLSPGEYHDLNGSILLVNVFQPVRRPGRRLVEDEVREADPAQPEPDPDRHTETSAPGPAAQGPIPEVVVAGSYPGNENRPGA